MQQNKHSLEIMDHKIESLKEKQIAKGFVLQQQGDTTMQAYFVKKGLLRSYYIDANGKEYTFMFAPENWIIADFSILANLKTAKLSIEALEESQISIIPRSMMETIHLLPEIELIKQIQRFINRIDALQTRVIILMSATAEEKYIDFLETYPDIVQRVSQKMIASYLGLSPEALSRVRKSLVTTRS